MYTTNITNHKDDPKHLPCIARADFVGDALFFQLTVRQHDRLEVDFSRPPQNGWRWAKATDNGQEGWVPDWATQPLLEGSVCRPSSSTLRRNSLRRSKDFIKPLESISESCDNASNNNCCNSGFDQRHNNILGGNIPRAQNADGRDPTEESTFPKPKSIESSSNTTKWDIPRVFQKPRIGNKSTYKNPYTQRQKEPEWDGCEVPQIVNDSTGRVAVLEANGEASHYRNERSHATTKRTQEVIEQVTNSTKAFGTKVSASVSKTSKTIGTKIKEQRQTRNETNQQTYQQPTKSNKSWLSKMPSMRTKKESNNYVVVGTHYCDPDGKVQSLVEEQRRASRTSLNIYY